MAYFLAAVMLRLICLETGLDCDFIIEGETEDEILSKGADHAIKVHDLKAEDIFFELTPCNFLCQILSKLSINRSLSQKKFALKSSLNFILKEKI